MYVFIYVAMVFMLPNKIHCSVKVFVLKNSKMLKKRLNNRYTGIYRTNDEIDNLKIR